MSESGEQCPLPPAAAAGSSLDERPSTSFVPNANFVDELKRRVCVLFCERRRRRCSHLQRCLSDLASVFVADSERRTTTTLRMTDSFVAYLIQTTVTDKMVTGWEDMGWTVWRRYSEFELLRNYLDAMYGAVIVPPLPEKRPTHVRQYEASSGRLEGEFVERRRVALGTFLQRIVAHPRLGADTITLGFLQQESGWRESVHATDYASRAGESRLSSLTAAYRLARPDPRFAALRQYATELESNVGSVLAVRTRLADTTYAAHRLHANFGRVFSEWAGLEARSPLGDALQTAGHYMDTYATACDDTLDSEDRTVVDTLKLASGYASSSLRSLVRRREVGQLALERCETQLASASAKREAIDCLPILCTHAIRQAQGRPTSMLAGLRSRLSSAETGEQRDARLLTLDVELGRLDDERAALAREDSDFVRESSAELDAYDRQKADDVGRALESLCRLQAELAERNVKLWSNMYACFERVPLDSGALATDA